MGAKCMSVAPPTQAQSLVEITIVDIFRSVFPQSVKEEDLFL